MNSVHSKWLTIAAWAVSWLLIFWLNFAAELPPYMHFVLIPLLLVSTAVGAGRYLEASDQQQSSD